MSLWRCAVGSLNQESCASSISTAAGRWGCPARTAICSVAQAAAPHARRSSVDICLVGEVETVNADMIRSWRHWPHPRDRAGGVGAHGESYNVSADLVAAGGGGAARGEADPPHRCPGHQREGRPPRLAADQARCRALIKANVIDGGCCPSWSPRCAPWRARRQVPSSTADPARRSPEVFTHEASDRNRLLEESPVDTKTPRRGAHLMAFTKRFPHRAGAREVCASGTRTAKSTSTSPAASPSPPSPLPCARGGHHPVSSHHPPHFSNRFPHPAAAHLAKLLCEHSFADRCSSATRGRRPTRPPSSSRASGRGARRQRPGGAS